ncbi:hypothetical protein ACFCWG_43365 [Streptomyces sp. NPDC056390]|uniref:hypothetical protein n=1 Tax=Streptomyces sp. NPDC056390 TaxID=3345806 RepID=UPI0035DCABC4
MLSWQYTERTVSIWTLSGRMKEVAFTAAPEHLARLALYRKGESDLLYRDGMWFLTATCEVPEAVLNTDVTQFLGIVNIATTSDGQIKAGRRLNRGRLRERTLRAGAGHQPQDREACGGRGRTHRSRNRPGRPHRYPRTGTASQAPSSSFSRTHAAPIATGVTTFASGVMTSSALPTSSRNPSVRGAR